MSNKTNQWRRLQHAISRRFHLLSPTPNYQGAEEMTCPDIKINQRYGKEEDRKQRNILLTKLLILSTQQEDLVWFLRNAFILIINHSLHLYQWII